MTTKIGNAMYRRAHLKYKSQQHKVDLRKTFMHIFRFQQKL
jgi:hypothetical protein